MGGSRVLILATPYLYATALAACLGLSERCEVVIPDVAGGASIPDQRYDVVVVAATDGTLPVDVVPAGDVTITLPAWSWDEPVIVRAGRLTTRLVVDPAGGLDQVTPLVRRYVDLTLRY